MITVGLLAGCDAGCGGDEPEPASWSDPCPEDEASEAWSAIVDGEMMVGSFISWAFQCDGMGRGFQELGRTLEESTSPELAANRISEVAAREGRKRHGGAWGRGCPTGMEFFDMDHGRIDTTDYPSLLADLCELPERIGFDEAEMVDNGPYAEWVIALLLVIGEGGGAVEKDSSYAKLLRFLYTGVQPGAPSTHVENGGTVEPDSGIPRGIGGGELGARRAELDVASTSWSAPFMSVLGEVAVKTDDEGVIKALFFHPATRNRNTWLIKLDERLDRVLGDDVERIEGRGEQMDLTLTDYQRQLVADGVADPAEFTGYLYRAYRDEDRVLSVELYYDGQQEPFDREGNLALSELGLEQVSGRVSLQHRESGPENGSKNGSR